jgi:uncharacterized protein
VSSPPAVRPRLRSFPRLKRFGKAAAVVIGVLVVLRYLVLSFVSIDANLLWFRAVDHESVYTRTFWTEALLFVIFAVLMAAAVAANLVVFYRRRPKGLRPDPARARLRYQFARREKRLRWWLFGIVVIYLAVTMGSRASGSWQTWLQWRNAVSFGQKDPEFHRDISYFLFVYPMHRLVLTLLFRILVTCIVLVLIAAYAYGGVRLRGTGPRMSRAVRAQLALLLGVYLVLKAFGYWLDRFALATSNRGVVTGPSYTDIHAALPGKFILVIIALICAVIMFASFFTRNSRLMLVSIAVMAGSAFVFGVAWPALVQQFREKPAASVVEIPSITRNIHATRQAFGLAGSVTVQPYPAVQTLHGTALAEQVAQNGQIRILDPNRLSPTFNVKQQIQSFYAFKSTLDIDRYDVDGESQDMALAVRELNLTGLPSSRRTWTNTHLIYTHGYGVVAAPTDTLPAGVPDFVERDLPPHGVISQSQPGGTYQGRIYYGQMSPPYSVVGAAPGSPPREYDRPSPDGGRPVNYTHTGGGGIPMGPWLNRLVYAINYRSPSLLFSSEINKYSQLLTIRNPRNRVAQVAPWLTLDGDVYPTVVNGRILWVVDGYTTSNNYPYSQQTNLGRVTGNTLTVNGSTVAQPNISVNYMRNSVKATVDAYSGKVTLYSWDQAPKPDPVLETWEHAFPGLVQPQSAIPAALLPHLRYPQDLFNLQRSLLTRYHVTDPSEFYSGSSFWRIPSDPTVGASIRLNSVGKPVVKSAPTIASTYMTMSPDGSTPGLFALSTPMVTLNLRNLAAVLTVDSQPGPGYGRFTLLQMPPSRAVESPAQIQNDIESTPEITSTLTLARGGNSKVVLGNLLTIPLGGQLLYIEPVYTQATGPNSFPLLRHVIAIYGTGAPAFEPTLPAALHQALGVPVH